MPTTASSTENGTFPASAAVDGNTGIRWSSAFSDPQWIRIDLSASPRPGSAGPAAAASPTPDQGTELVPSYVVNFP